MPRATRAKQARGRRRAAPPEAIPWSEFTADVQAVYASKARKTLKKVLQVVREIGATPHPASGRVLVATTADLKPRVIAYWKAAHPARKPATVDSLMRSLRSAVEIGCCSGYWHRNPLDLAQLWDDVEAAVVDEADDPYKFHPIADVQKVLLDLQERALFDWRTHRLYTVASVVALTGIRKMECLRLRKEDVDLATPCLKIRPARQARARLKTRASAAPVGVPGELVDILRWWLPQIQGGPYRDSPWLFPGVTGKGAWDGGPPGHKPLDQLKAAGERVGVKGFTFLSLRHSWATHAEFWGLGETLIQRQLRHTTTRTQQVYRHADAVNLAKAVGGIGYGVRLDGTILETIGAPPADRMAEIGAGAERIKAARAAETPGPGAAQPGPQPSCN